MAPIETVLQKGHSSYQKYHVAKMAPNINGISQNWYLTTLLAFWSTTNTLVIEPNPAIRHRRVTGISLWSRKNSTFKSHYHKSESYNKFKNFLLKISQLSPWHFFASCTIFVRHHFLWVSCLPISGRVFIMCHLYKVTIISNNIKGCHFRWVYLMVVNLQLFTVLPVVWRQTSDKTWSKDSPKM